MTARPPASLSLDLDDQWSYMKTHGDAGWESFPSYLDAFVPLVLERLAARGLRLTVFVVGQDAALPRNRGTLAAIAERGHELGNHSFHHEQWIHLHSRERIRGELAQASDAIGAATGRLPRGYRGPGFSWSGELLEALGDAGYLYDASTLPTWLGPLARRYYFRSCAHTKAEREERRDLFGPLSAGRHPVKPYRWRLACGRTLLEIPVTTVPLVKTPFHLSYLLYLSRYSMTLMLAYLRVALALCRWTRTEPSFLLHPLDLLGAAEAPHLAFFPGMDLDAGHKRAVFDRVLDELARRFTLLPLGEHAERIGARRLAIRDVPVPVP
jgi:hypothetical protein